MIETQARVETPNGSKYLQQLCKHFGHKIETTFDAQHGECRFEMGTATMDADDTGVTVKISAADDAGVARLQGVIESHLVRFAFREELNPFHWAPAA